MGEEERPSGTSRGKVIRLVQFQEAPEQEEVSCEEPIRVQVKVAATPEKLGRKIITYLTTELRSSEDCVTVTNKDARFRILIHAVETTYPHEIVMAVVFTSVLDLTPIHDIDLTDEKIKAWGLNVDQIAAMRQLQAGAALHHMALEHGLKILYSSGGQRTIEPYETILSLQAWKAPADDLGRAIKTLTAEFEDSVLHADRNT
ncbi:MAG: hypothetical protein P8182_10765 [Deltaproteobacteria bacterium]